MTIRILIGDCRDRLKELADESVHCVVTSPPYWGLRDYGVDGQIGLEPTYTLFLEQMLAVFREVHRVLRYDGTLWLNLGDGYATGTSSGRKPTTAGKHGYWENPSIAYRINGAGEGLKPKDLCGIPWRVAFALQADGWYLRQDIIWSKPNPMPESVTDRCTKAHEYLFLLTKSERYYFDNEAIKEPASENTHARMPENKTHKGVAAYGAGDEKHRTKSGLVNYARRKRAASGSGIKNNESMDAALEIMPSTRNKRSVWAFPSEPFPEAHFATFPPALVEPCIVAGTSQRGCCPHCGMGWERITAKVNTGKRQKMPDGMATYGGSHAVFHRDGREKGQSDNPVTVSVTIGWYPSCDCIGAPHLPPYPDPPSRAKMGGERAYKAAHAEWLVACGAVDLVRKRLCDALQAVPTNPAIALDPFGGAGTTGLVADRLGRNAVIIELNPKYAVMAERRISDDAPLFAQTETSRTHAEPRFLFERGMP